MQSLFSWCVKFIFRTEITRLSPCCIFNSPERHPPAIDNVFGKEWCMNLWREEERGQQTDPSLDSSIIREESVDLVDEGPDMILIKEETWEDCLGKNNTQSEPVADGRGQMMPSNNISGSASVTQSQTDSFVTYAITSDNQVGQSTQHRGPDSISTATLPTTHGDNTSEPNLDSEEFVRLYPNTINFNPMQNQRSPRGDKKFECVFCGKSFTYLGYLKVHLRQHSGEKPFACTMCGKRFARKTYLKLHQRTHSGEKPYTCMECGKSFSQKSSLNVHLRTHTGEKPFNCVECGKSYTHKHGFNKHQCIS